MKQQDIRLGISYHIQTRTGTEVDYFDWLGVKFWNHPPSQIKAMVIRKGIENPENPRWKDRVEIRIEDEDYKSLVPEEYRDGNSYPQNQIIPARHVIEGVEARKARKDQEAYDKAWREALTENTARERAGKIAVGIVEQIDSTRRLAAWATRDELNQLESLQNIIDRRINEIKEGIVVGDGYLPEPANDELPADDGFTTLADRLRNYANQSDNNNNLIKAWNALVEIGVSYGDE